VVTPGASFRIGVGSSFVDELQNNEVAVVIDNLRASSTIVTALWMGVGEVIPVLDDQMAFALREQGTLTAGESGGIKISGYDIGNSPVELAEAYKQSPFQRLIIKTSNMVPLLLRLKSALICSGLNLTAMAGYLRGQRAAIIAAGGPWGTAEDVGVALALVSLASGVVLDIETVGCFTHECRAAYHLQQIGYAHDVDFISQTGIYDVLPIYENGKIRALKGSP